MKTTGKSVGRAGTKRSGASTKKRVINIDDDSEEEEDDEEGDDEDDEEPEEPAAKKQKREARSGGSEEGKGYKALVWVCEEMEEGSKRQAKAWAALKEFARERARK